MAGRQKRKWHERKEAKSKEREECTFHMTKDQDQIHNRRRRPIMKLNDAWKINFFAVKPC